MKFAYFLFGMTAMGALAILFREWPLNWTIVGGWAIFATCVWLNERERERKKAMPEGVGG